MKLRLVVPTLGTSPWLAAAVDSWRNLPSLDAVAVCPAELAAKIGPQVAGARTVGEAGRGLYAALNQGFRADGDWDVGTWLNDDDVLLPTGFARARDALSADPTLDAVFGRVDLIDASDRFLADIPVARRGDDLGPLLAAGVVPVAQPGLIFRRNLFERLRGLDVRLQAAADLDFFSRACAAGARFGYVDAPVARFRVHRGQISKQRELVARETAAIFAAAAARPEWQSRAMAAKRRFRLGNWRAYLGRVARHGWTSMEALYGHE